MQTKGDEVRKKESEKEEKKTKINNILRRRRRGNEGTRIHHIPEVRPEVPLTNRPPPIHLHNGGLIRIVVVGLVFHQLHLGPLFPLFLVLSLPLPSTFHLYRRLVLQLLQLLSLYHAHVRTTSRPRPSRPARAQRPPKRRLETPLHTPCGALWSRSLPSPRPSQLPG